MKRISVNNSRILSGLVALSILPLLMANSPAPYRGPTNYMTFEVGNYSIAESVGTEGTLHIHDFDVKNNGEGYMALFTFSALDSSTGEIIASYDGYNNREVIAPDTTHHLSFVHTERYEFADLTFSCYAFSREFAPDAARFASYFDFAKQYYLDSDTFVYSFNCEYDLLNDEYGTYYNPIFKLKDKDSIHYFYGETLQNYYEFHTDADIDIGSLEIEAVTYFKGYDYYKGNEAQGANAAQAAFFVFIILGLSLTLAGAIVGGVFLIRHIKKSKG